MPQKSHKQMHIMWYLQARDHENTVLYSFSMRFVDNFQKTSLSFTSVNHKKKTFFLVFSHVVSLDCCNFLLSVVLKCVYPC